MSNNILIFTGTLFEVFGMMGSYAFFKKQQGHIYEYL